MFIGTLLPYQPEAVDKMCKRGSMLVAYDLGLGKTVLTIAALERLMDEGRIREPGLIICLSSLKYQWASQIEKFTDGSKPLVIDGPPSKRAEQYQEAMDWKDSNVDYVILNYEQVVNDWSYVSKLPRGFVVLDEATAIKSFKSKRSKSVKKLGTAPWRFALTGTPIENGKPEELYSIMQFVDPSVLGRFDHFDKTFIMRGWNGWVNGYKNLNTFHELMKQASVRKAQTDADVAPYLPKTIHKAPIMISFDRATAKLYKTISSEIVQDIKNAMENFGPSFNLSEHYGYSSSKRYSNMDEARGQIMAKVGCLKMLCSNPALLRISAEKFKSLNGGSSYAYFLSEEGLLDGIKNSPKLEFLTSYIKDFLSSSELNKVVIFASYIDMVHMIAESIGTDVCVTYTGELDAKTKEEQKDKFNNDLSIRVFVSSDAGGYGVDLPAANLLINYDLPWSAGTAAQRNGRIRRASSTWPTIVIQDLLIVGSIEERQHEVLQQKNSVASAIIDGDGFDDKGELTFNINSLTKFLEGESA